MEETNKRVIPPLHAVSFEKGSCGFGMLASLDGPTRKVLTGGLESLKRLMHRGAIDADNLSGDGCGINFTIPRAFFQTVCASLNIPFADKTIVAQVFFSTDPDEQAYEQHQLTTIAQQQGYSLVGVRVVPTRDEFCGSSAKAYLPAFKQLFFEATTPSDHQKEITDLYCIRKKVEASLRQHETFYICSFSSKLICYKALVLPDNLSNFFPDLTDENMQAEICIVHQRFATNTVPQWRLAQPFHHLAHNGEINTIRGNRFWLEARTPNFLKHPALQSLRDATPLFSHEESDSASLDELSCLLTAGGMSILESMRIAIPPSWGNQPGFSYRRKAYYEYFSMCMEPWDGPASIAFTDGTYAACIADRNGLRPARWVLTDDNILTIASEIGVRNYTPKEVVSIGKLAAGELLVADLSQKKILGNEELFRTLERGRKFATMLKSKSRVLTPDRSQPTPYTPFTSSPEALTTFHKLHGLSREELESVIKPLAQAGAEAIGSMGDDTPLPLLSSEHRSLYDYFRQQFAQVTNPPIDSIRETLVMSLETCIGPEPSFFDTDERHVDKIVMRSPLLSQRRFNRLKKMLDDSWGYQEMSLNVPLDLPLKEGLESIVSQALACLSKKESVIILSDRGCTKDQYPIHALLATGAVHHALLKHGLRTKTALIVETATMRDPHHLAVLLAYGASAVYPFLAYETIFQSIAKGDHQANATMSHAYRKGMNKGLLKILSKMGISTISSYRSSALFEIVGLSDEVVDYCFRLTPSRVGGETFESLNHATLANQASSFNLSRPQTAGGLLKFMHGGEYHAFNPDVVRTLQEACRENSPDAYQRYAALVNNRPATVLRDLLELNIDPTKKIPLSEVEPIKDIFPRFDSAGMSLGALSPEAHVTLARAMNSIGGRSNSGEGGEDSSRYGTDAESKIKQVASGRFGVTPYYLRNAEVLQIKIAQGAKPGEGGQLPGDKVNPLIAKLRLSMPGVSLISPPPHHDIYSIEDLAQLIFDLKQLNPSCLVSVKLVSEAGVGTIATGVAKAYADFITIAGYDGGTGASPLTSVKYAGTPWELGLPETHQLLVANNVRHKVRLQVDGGLKTGIDVVKGAILGAESFGFGTAPMIAMGCKYLRICHLNNCATGIATQHDVLRRLHFHGEVQMVINFFTFIAEETRQLMAALGVRKLTDLIGRTDLLAKKPPQLEKHGRVNLDAILAASKTVSFGGKTNDSFDKGELAEKMVADSTPFIDECAIYTYQNKKFEYPIKNYNRSIGARVSGEITERYGNKGLGNNTLSFHFTGTAGQSFGAWNTIGMNLVLSGDANDYVGKGQHGGVIALCQPPESTLPSADTTIAGNTCLYGATGGRFFAAGKVGERFAVRNSGAIAVIEGAGNHCCEYMTGGMVIVLGATGTNFAAGMTGGIAFCYDHDNTFVDRYNNELVDIDRISIESMSDYQLLLSTLLEEHHSYTKSKHAAEIIENFDDVVEKFWLISPKAADLQELLNSLKLAA